MSDINAATAQQIRDLIRRQNEHHIEMADWLGGTADGGPNTDGRYPLSDGLGRSTLVPSPASFEDRVSGPAGQAYDAMLAAITARDNARSSELEATVQKQLAEVARTASVDARDMALTHRNTAGTHEANARYWAELAQGYGGTTSDDREAVEQLAAEVAANASDAAQDADDAAASAALAATFDPSLYDKKADTLASSRLTGVIDVARIPILPSQKQFASSGGLANLTTSQQNEIGQGSIVTTTDGRRFVYSGSGSKTVEASYVVLADVTPDWSNIADKPSFFPTNIANVSGLQSALDGKAGMADIQWTNANVTTKANLAGGNTFTGPQFIGGVTSAQNGLVIETTGNVTTGQSYDHGAELVVSSYQPRIKFNDRSTNARGMIQHWNGSESGGNMRWMFDTAGDGLFSDEVMKLNANKSLQLGANLVLTTATGVEISKTNLGAAYNVPLVGGTRNAAWWASLATGYNVMTNLTTANGSPQNGHGYFFKMARRDADNGWCGLWQSYTGPEMWFGGANTSADMPGWYRLWNSGNFNPDSKLNCHANQWIGDTSGAPRFFFSSSNGVTFYRGSAHEWRNTADTQIASIDAGGTFRAGGEVYAGGANWFRVLGPSHGIYWEAHAGGWFMNDSTWMRVYNNKGILTNGRVSCSGYDISSDRRLKSNIEPIQQSEASRIIDQTNTYSFVKGGVEQLGVIAQEAREVVPILVREGGDMSPDGDPYLAVDLTGYIPVLIKEVQGLRTRVAELEDGR